MEYIQSHKSKERCVFCLEMEREDGPENLIVVRGEHCFVIVNRYPYTSGHLMVVSFEHQSSIEQLDCETRAEMMNMAAQCMQVLRRVYHPEGFNLGINVGEAAGAGVIEHVHLHVVPRWGGDTNFMSSLAQTRVLPEALEETYRRVRREWESSYPFTSENI